MVTLPCSRNRNGGTTSAHRITISTAASTAVWRAERRDQRVSAGPPAAAASSRACAKSAEVVTRRVPSLERFWPPLCSQPRGTASGYLPLVQYSDLVLPVLPLGKSQYDAMMNVVTNIRLTVDEYLAWAEGRPGRYELYDGAVYAMTPECAAHATMKLAIHMAFAAGVRARRLPCHVMPDG